MPDSLSVAIPCRSSEPGLFATFECLGEACLHEGLARGLIAELLICINGIRPGEKCPPLAAVREFCHDYDILCEEVWGNEGLSNCRTSHRDSLSQGKREPTGRVSLPYCRVLLT